MPKAPRGGPEVDNDFRGQENPISPRTDESIGITFSEELSDDPYEQMLLAMLVTYTDPYEQARGRPSFRAPGQTTRKLLYPTIQLPQ